MQVMNRDQFDSWFEENISRWLSEQVANAPDPYSPAIEEEPDRVGVLAVSNMFSMIAAFLSDMEDDLSVFDHKMSLSHAYALLAGSISWGMDAGVLDDSWSTVCDLFAQRSDEFAGAPEVDIEFLADDLYRWVVILERLFFKWTDAHSKNADLTDADRILLVRSTLIMLRNARYIEYEGWVKELIASLDVDWRIMGGGFPTTIDPNYVPPWSSG